MDEDALLDKFIAKTDGTEDTSVDTSTDDTSAGTDAAGGGEPSVATAQVAKAPSQTAATDASSATTATTAELGPTEAPQGRVTSNAKGDLVDAAGRVVATAGRERRYYESMQRGMRATNEERQRAETLAAQVAQKDQEIATWRQAASAATQLGLNANEALEGQRIIAAYKKDPLGTIKYILDEAAKAGHDITAITSGGGVSPAAIKAMVEQAIAPILSDRQQYVNQQQSSAQVDQEYNNFIDENPEAVHHEDAIVVLMQNNPDLTVHTAYAAVLKYAAINRLDINQPLGPQMQARSSATASNPQAQSAPLPNGRGTVGSSAAASSKPVTNTPSAEADMKQIVRAAMLEHGMSV